MIEGKEGRRRVELAECVRSGNTCRLILVARDFKFPIKTREFAAMGSLMQCRSLESPESVS